MARMRRAGLSIKPTTHRSCCAAHKKAQTSNQAKSSPARSIQDSGPGDQACPANAVSIGGLWSRSCICRTYYNCTSRYLSERPVPCLASGKRWVHGNGSFFKQPLVDTDLRTAGMPRVAPLCFESTGIMREGLRPWRKKFENFFIFLWGWFGSLVQQRPPLFSSCRA